MPNSQQTRPETADEQFKMLFARTAKLNDAVSALLAPAWGSEAGIIPTGHPLYVGDKPPAQQEEQGAPVDWQDIAKRRERELKTVGEARHRAENAVAELAQAIRLTREYVGEEMLPAVEGWSWYDALRRWAPDLLDAMTQPETATQATEPREHCGDLKPQFTENTERTECVLRPGHKGSHADQNGTRWWWTDDAIEEHPEEQPEPAAITDPAYLRQQYAAIISALYDNRPDHIAAELLRVRDRHLAQLRQRLRLADELLATRDAELAAAKKTARGIGAWGVLQAIEQALPQGPTVAEAAADDARHWNDKYAGEGQ